MTIEEIINKVSEYNCNLVEVTGGEPLFQDECPTLLEKLNNEGFTVLLETGGSLPIKDLDKRTVIIMDIKTPSSGMIKKNMYDNINYLKPSDEVKFVIGSREDYDWSKMTISEYKISQKCKILFSAVFNKLSPRTLVEWILEDKLNVRFQLQAHKFIWSPDTKGV